MVSKSAFHKRNKLSVACSFLRFAAALFNVPLSLLGREYAWGYLYCCSKKLTAIHTTLDTRDVYVDYEFIFGSCYTGNEGMVVKRFFKII